MHRCRCRPVLAPGSSGQATVDEAALPERSRTRPRRHVSGDRAPRRSDDTVVGIRQRHDLGVGDLLLLRHLVRGAVDDDGDANIAILDKHALWKKLALTELE